jgi:aspartate dehydrogenase
LPPMALLGYGAIGQEIAAVLQAMGEIDSLRAILVRPGRDAGGYPAVTSLEALLASGAEVVLECAGHGAVEEYGPAVLAAGLDLVITSTGILADEAVVGLLRAAAEMGGRLLIAPGAVAGLDGLLAARLAGLTAVTYTSYKPPHAWRGTAAERAIDLDHAEEAVTFFEGSARDAALAYPKNANVAVTVGVCGLGLDRTRARLVSSRALSDPLGVIEAEGAFGRFRFEIFARAAPGNPKTSLLTAHSLLQCARLGIGLPVLALMDRSADRILGGGQRC